MTSLYKLGKSKANRDEVKANESDLEFANRVIQRVMYEVSKMPPNVKIVIGTSSGWLVGLLAMKIGRTLALAIGGGLILLQVCCDRGYVSVNWNQVNKHLKNGEENSKRFFRSCAPQPSSIPVWMQTLMECAVHNMTLSVGLLGGFLIGLATC